MILISLKFRNFCTRFKIKDLNTTNLQTMKKLLKQMLLLLAVGLSVSATPKTTFCEQELLFFFKTRYDENTLWIGENRYGECSSSNLWQVFVPNDSAVVAKKTTMKRFNDWMWAEKLQMTMDEEKPLQLTDEDEKGCGFKDLGIRVNNPKFNKNLDDLFTRDFTHDCALQWTQATGQDGIDLPELKGLDGKLLYYHPMGLYFNYQVTKAYLFPVSKLLLVFTRNPRRCTGGDTMHGFLIFRTKSSN